MCTTASLGALGMGMQVGGAIYSGIGAYSQARGTRYGFEQQAAVAEMNAKAIEHAAAMTAIEERDAYQRGATEEQRLMAAGTALKGRQRAVLAASGVVLDRGSALNILTDTDVGIEADAALLREGVEREAAGIRMKAARMRVDAASVRAGGAAYSGAAGSVSAGGAAFSSLLGSAGLVADRWYKNSLRTGG